MEVYRQINTPVQRTTAFEAQQAINDALLEVNQFHNWNFLLDRYDILLTPAYTTGGVSIAASPATTFTGVGTTWDTTWVNRKILFQNDVTEKEVVNFTSPTAATLRYPTSGSNALTNVPYTIYQDQYPIPIPLGRDLLIINPVLRYRLVKFDRLSLEDRSVWWRFASGIQATHYTDAGTDITPFLGDGVTPNPTYRQQLIKIWPPLQALQNLVLIYYRNIGLLSNPTDTTILPPEFDEVVIRLATYRLRKQYGIPGWVEDHTVAMRQLLQFRELHTVSAAYDYLPQWGMFPFGIDPWGTDAALGIYPGVIR